MIIHLFFSFQNSEVHHTVILLRTHVSVICLKYIFLGEHFSPQLHAMMGVVQIAGLSLCIFMFPHYQGEASVCLVGVKVSGG